MSETRFQPDWVSPPGDTITEILKIKSLSPEHLAKELGWKNTKLEKLLTGEETITDQVARVLQTVLGSSAAFWLAREAQYRSDLSRLNPSSWLTELPLNDMAKFNWWDFSKYPDRMTACLRFFNVSTVAQWRRQYADILQAVAFRTSPTFKSDAGALAAWIREGELQGLDVACERWNSTRFRESLLKIRKITRENDPSKFIPELKRICAQAGVLVSIVRAPTGCRASGATRFLSNGKAMILLSFRYLSDDHFWFTFFHEASHLLLHTSQRLFLEGDFMLPSSPKEKEANQFAADLLVPPNARKEMVALPGAPRPIIRFARKIGVSRGIVVGQLQHAGILRKNQLNYLKQRYRWE